MKVSEMEARGSKTLVAGEPMREPSWLVWTLMKGFRVAAADGAVDAARHGRGTVLRHCGRGGAGARLHTSTPEMDLAYRNVCDSGCDLHAGRLRVSVEPGADGAGGSQQAKAG